MLDISVLRRAISALFANWKQIFEKHTFLDISSVVAVLRDLSPMEIQVSPT